MKVAARFAAARGATPTKENVTGALKAAEHAVDLMKKVIPDYEGGKNEGRINYTLMAVTNHLKTALSTLNAKGHTAAALDTATFDEAVKHYGPQGDDFKFIGKLLHAAEKAARAEKDPQEAAEASAVAKACGEVSRAMGQLYGAVRKYQAK